MHENKAVSYKNHGLKAFNLDCRAFILKKKKKKKKKKMEKSQFGRFPYIPLAKVSSYFMGVFR